MQLMMPCVMRLNMVLHMYKIRADMVKHVLTIDEIKGEYYVGSKK